jgi:hypothetical protein
VTVALSEPQATAQPDPNQVRAVQEKLGVIASELSQTLFDSSVRDILLAETQRSNNPQKVLDLRELVDIAQPRNKARSSGWTNILDAMDTVDALVRGKVREAGAAAIRLDAYFPVKDHREKWDGGPNLLVLAPPLDENDIPEEFIAYSVKDQKTVSLNSKEPPDTPTLVINVGEHSVEELAAVRPAELTMATEAPGPENRISITAASTYIGLPWVSITNNSEPWYKGDPELYVRVTQWWYGQQLPTKTVDLPGVNDEYRWYWYGDPRGTLYYPFDAGYGNKIEFKFMEEDDWPDSDDYMGTVTIYRYQVPPGDDHKLFAAKYMRVFADID